MKKRYRFVGTELVIDSVGWLKTLGQAVELTDAQRAAIGGKPLIPEQDFAACGFTEAELQRYAYPASRVTMDAGFEAKLRKAWRFAAGVEQVKKDQKED